MGRSQNKVRYAAVRMACNDVKCIANPRALDWPVLEPLRVLTDGIVDGLCCVGGLPPEAEQRVDNAFEAAGWRKVDDAWVRDGFEAHRVAGQGKIKTCHEDNQSFVGISLTRKL